VSYPATTVAVETRSQETRLPRVILAEDDAETRELIAESLRAAGHEVEEAVDGRDAFAAVLRELPALLITDCTMPNMSGTELVELLALDSQLPRIPTILISALERPPPSTNVTAFLAKPFTMKQLHAVVRECLPRDREPSVDPDD